MRIDSAASRATASDEKCHVYRVLISSVQMSLFDGSLTSSKKPSFEGLCWMRMAYYVIAFPEKTFPNIRRGHSHSHSYVAQNFRYLVAPVFTQQPLFLYFKRTASFIKRFEPFIFLENFFIFLFDVFIISFQLFIPLCGVSHNGRSISTGKIHWANEVIKFYSAT